MPTVLEVLRTQLIGDEAADAIEQLLAVLSASVLLIPRTPVPSVPVRPSLPTASAEGANPIIEALRTPSPGIEPLLLGEGWSPLAARAIASSQFGTAADVKTKAAASVPLLTRSAALRTRSKNG